jgi:hypothetical protein
MSDLHQAVEDYLTVRRALGSKLERHPWLLNDFVAYLQAAGATTVTAELCAGLGLAARTGHPSDLCEQPVECGTRVRPSPAGLRSGDRGATGPAGAQVEVPGHALPVFRR